PWIGLMLSTPKTATGHVQVVPAQIVKTGRRWFFQTPVYRMRRGADGRTVWLVGMTHYALPEYYRHTVELINEIRSGGAVVLREGGGVGEALTRLHELEPVERDLLRATEEFYRWQEVLSCYGGRITQSQGWGDAPQLWQRVDITLLEQARLRGDLDRQV